MRIHQISPEEAQSAEAPMCLAVVPVRCRCLAQGDHAKADYFTNAVEVTVGGMIIGDAVVKFDHYTSDGERVAVEFTGTVPVYTDSGIMGAIERVRKVPVEVWGRGLIGMAHDVTIEVTGIVTLVDPSGKVTQLVGADR